jgi:hypothetical protein
MTQKLPAFASPQKLKQPLTTTQFLFPQDRNCFVFVRFYAGKPAFALVFISDSFFNIA